MKKIEAKMKKQAFKMKKQAFLLSMTYYYLFHFKLHVLVIGLPNRPKGILETVASYNNNSYINS